MGRSIVERVNMLNVLKLRVLYRCIACLGVFLVFFGQAFAQVISVSNVGELVNAVSAANNTGGNTTILLQDGTYTLGSGLWIAAPHITIAGASGNPENVTIEGDDMSSSAAVGNVITVAASYFELRDVTLQKSRWHLIQIKGENNADNPTIKNCILRDAYEQLLKVTLNSANPTVSSDNGLIENSVFEYSAGIGPQYYIGGIDAHGSKNWVVRNNTFRHIISPSGSVAEFAVHFWSGSNNNTVEKNLIMNCDRGIGFGLDGRGNFGGIIRNNMIYRSANAGPFADVGIALTESPNTQVYNNTIYLDDGFPWSIEYRFSSTINVLLVNNLTNKPIRSRDGATGIITGNVTNATGTWFVNSSVADLHLGAAVSAVVDNGQTVSGLSDDFDSQVRPQGFGIDIGADEYRSGATLRAPTNLRILNP